MKIAIDTSPLFGMSSSRGVGMYTKRLIEFLRKQEVEIFEFKNGKIPNKVDLVHYPYFFPFFISLPFFQRKKFVVTVHDLTPLVFPKAYPPGIKGKIKFLLQKELLRNAAGIITDSENSQKDIIKFLDFPKEKIDVIYLAPANNVERISDKKILSKIVQKYDLPAKFVLYIGDVNYNKNLPGLLKSCRLVNIPLVIAGKQAVRLDFDRSNVENQPLIELNNLIGQGGDVIKTGFVEQEELAGLYSLASVYCQPSFYEGFGIQILESMSCGCPVVTSNVSSLPEVAGKAAILVDPSDIQSIAEGIETVIKDDLVKKRLVTAGFEQVKKFSWEKTTKETKKVYEKVLAKQ